MRDHWSRSFDDHLRAQQRLALNPKVGALRWAIEFAQHIEDVVFDTTPQQAVLAGGQEKIVDLIEDLLRPASADEEHFRDHVIATVDAPGLIVALERSFGVGDGVQDLLDSQAGHLFDGKLEGYEQSVLPDDARDSPIGIERVGSVSILVERKEDFLRRLVAVEPFRRIANAEPEAHVRLHPFRVFHHRVDDQIAGQVGGIRRRPREQLQWFPFLPEIPDFDVETIDDADGTFLRVEAAVPVIPEKIVFPDQQDGLVDADRMSDLQLNAVVHDARAVQAVAVAWFPSLLLQEGLDSSALATSTVLRFHCDSPYFKEATTPDCGASKLI